MKIPIVNGKCKSELFDKRDEFSFRVISLPHMNSSVPGYSSYGVFISQVYRLFHVNSDLLGFITVPSP